MLGGAAQDVERRFGPDVLPLHEDSLSLPDHLSGGQGGVKVGRLALIVLVGSGRGDGHAGHRRQQQTPAPVDHPEGVRVASVEIEGPGNAIDR